MQVVRWLLVCCIFMLFLAPSFADDKPADLIVGKWETKEKRGDQEITATVEFTKDNKMKISFGQINIDGTYKIVSDSELELTMTFMMETRTEKTKFKVTKDALEFTSKEGKTTKFTKAK
jgi:uncharacterized protein (TIGR03066 family)